MSSTTLSMHARRLAPPGAKAPGLPAAFREAGRSQESLLAPLEKVCLAWLARRIPASIGPDHLTLLGLGAMLAAGACYALAAYRPAALFLAGLCLAANWFGDSLDGTLARLRNRQRPRYGFYVDHMVDTFGALFLLGGLALSGYMSASVALALLLGFYMLSINVYLATYTMGTFRLSFWKFSPTEMRILIALGSAVAFFRPRVFGGGHLFFDVAGVIAAAIMAIALVVSVALNTRALYRMERI